LQDGADNHDGGAEHNHTLAAQGVSDKDGDDGADEAAEVVRGHSNALVGRPGRRLRVGDTGSVGVDHRERVEEDLEGQDAAHDSLVCGTPC
jgi:hypothetical protein